MKIVIIGTVASSVVGFRADFIRSLIVNGHEVYAFATDYTEVTKGLVFSMGAIPVDYILQRSGLNPFRDLLNTYVLSLKLKELKPDLVFSYFVKPVIFGTLAAKLAGISNRVGMLEGLGYVFTDHPSGCGFKVRILRRVQVALYRFTFPFLDKLIFLNKDDPIDLIEKYRLSVKSIDVLGGIGVNLDEYKYSMADVSNVSFLFVGRLLAEKGIHQFVDAAKIVKVKYPDAEFIVLGSIDLENPGSISESTLNDLIFNKIITYPGHVSNVQEWIKKSSIFVLPSYYREGVPRSTQEAMAIGRAIITTDMPGCRDTVIDGENGFLVPPWSCQAIAEKMIYFIENKEKILEMGEKSHQIALEKYDSKIVNRRLLSLLNIKSG